MIAERIEARHIAGVQAWLLARGKKPWPKAMLEGPGFAVDGLAAAWLFSAPPFAIIECLVANPAAEDAERDAALDAVVRAVLDDARQRGCKVVLATTGVEAVKARAQRLGFSMLSDNNALLAANVGGP